jgi:two-component system CheB/CheR fusion protein
MAFVVVQHLSPSYKSMLPQLLSRETPLPVVEIVHGQQPQPDTIYITPPNRNALLRNGCLELVESPREAIPKPSANLFFTSLAEECREDAIGIILSGTGSDGTSGIRAIKASGGFTFAQDPASARYEGMPQSAIDTGCVDWIKLPEDIAAELERLAQARPVLPVAETQELPLTALKRLLSKVRIRTKLDFSGYKETTLWRRVERRLFANRCPTLDSYLELVEKNPAELEKLAKDILISVTSFFRDRDAFQALESGMQQIIAGKKPGDELRIWVPGCATGEEAYSLAILLHRQLEGNFDQFRIQIFATDVDMDAMQVARRGVYSLSSLGDMDPELIRRYFRVVDDRYEIVKTIRDVVIFARQDLVLDPPFLRLDLVSCRNVLIYLQPALQARILSLFHYALLPEGYLLLGKSESVAQQDLLFSARNKDARLFRRRTDSNRPPALATGLSPLFSDPSMPPPPPRSQANREQEIGKAVQGLFVPPGVVVNGQMQIVHVLGRANDYLQIPPGRVSLNLGNLLIRELKVEVQALLRNCEQRNAAVIGRRRLPLSESTHHFIRLAVHPLPLQSSERLFLVSFTPADAPSEELPPAPEGDASRKQLEDELTATREHLQTLVEELETSNEEMQALNEEVQAANEELQATNEELEAANEELQSTNEELLTINEELQVKSTDLTRTNTDLECIQNNVGMPILVVDQDTRLTRFNAAAEVLFKMHRGLVGQGLDTLMLPVAMQPFAQAVCEAMQQRRPRDIQLTGDGREYLLRITLNFGSDNLPLGAILSFLDQTELLRTSRLLQESESRMRAVLDHSPFLVAIKDLSGRYLYANEHYRRYFCPEQTELKGLFDDKIMASELAKHFRDEELIVLRRRELVESTTSAVCCGGLRWLQFIRFPLNDHQGENCAICIHAIDVTEKQHAEEQLQLAARVINGAAEAVIVTDPMQRIVTVNQAFCQITGYTADEVIGRTPALLKSGRHDDDYYRGMWKALQREGIWQGEIENRRKNGEIYAEWLTINAIKDKDGKLLNYVAIFSDISSLREARRRLEFQALHDVLTGLPNRALLNDRLESALARASRTHSRFALIFIDLDNFKDINDGLGHDTGDVLLRSVADRLQGELRIQDTVARMGGDEFVLLVEEIKPGEIELLVERCRSALAAPLQIRGRDVRVSASMGIALYPEDGNDPVQLLQSADAAMYRAKQAGRNTYCFTSAETRLAPHARLQLIHGLRQALDGRNELELVYQPLFSLPDRRVVGLEALMRWHSPELGDVQPEDFIPAAEESGLILPLTDWLLQTVVGQINRWRSARLPELPVSLNISPLHIRSQNLGDNLQRHLEAGKLPPSAIRIEIAERANSHGPDTLTTTLLQLKGLGVTSSLDDFGTGTSSLARLARLPLHSLKIDRSFIQGLDAADNRQGLEVTRTAILMAHSMGMTALAEGVETAAQLAVLEELGCDQAQGFLFARPLAADAVYPTLGLA